MAMSFVSTALSFWKGPKERQRGFPRILGHDAAGRKAAQGALLILILLLLPAGAHAQELGSRLSAAAAADDPDQPANYQCPAAKPGIWALVVILGIVAALSDGYILHSELAIRRARKAAKERARERSRAAANGAAAWGYPPNAPPMPRQGI